MNTVIYVILSVSKLIPVMRRTWFRKPKDRAETRSIYPEGVRPQADDALTSPPAPLACVRRMELL